MVLLKPMLRFFFLHSDIIELLMMAKRMDIIQVSIRVRLEPFRASIASLLSATDELVDYAIAIRTGTIVDDVIEVFGSGGMQGFEPEVIDDQQVGFELPMQTDGYF